MNRIKDIPKDDKVRLIRKKRKELVKKTKDQSRNIERATENIGAICIICGNRIKKGQPVRRMPKDKHCQEDRVYHFKTCGPGSINWKKFKDNDKKTPNKKQWIQLSFKWKGGKK